MSIAKMEEDYKGSDEVQATDGSRQSYLIGSDELQAEDDDKLQPYHVDSDVPSHTTHMSEYQEEDDHQLQRAGRNTSCPGYEPFAAGDYRSKPPESNAAGDYRSKPPARNKHRHGFESVAASDYRSKPPAWNKHRHCFESVDANDYRSSPSAWSPLGPGFETIDTCLEIMSDPDYETIAAGNNMLQHPALFMPRPLYEPVVVTMPTRVTQDVEETVKEHTLQPPRDYLIPSLVACLFCCPVGMSAVYYSAQAISLKEDGHMVAAHFASEKALKYIKLSLVSILIIPVALILVMVMR